MGIGSIGHWIVLLIIVILIFGTKRLRNIGKDLGGAVHDFKEGLNGAESKEETSSSKTDEKSVEKQISSDDQEKKES